MQNVLFIIRFKNTFKSGFKYLMIQTQQFALMFNIFLSMCTNL